ncbi:hypothetical protein HPB52_003353 [Rhipicephalus sanguineus]|uniref:Uncharacterized protein n=1 Tax=Rhipicephalus sanguineus TaxID=34632 RepID=A0A9D4PCG6_RHISA|nr:hypothetical protein HPB52_003353 [Rhipicephalus sanguineus]
MERLSRSLSLASSQERPKNAPERDLRAKSHGKREPVATLLDIGTVLELRGEVLMFDTTPVLVYSAKYRAARDRWLWDAANRKGYFIHKTRVRETVLRPVLRLYNSITDVTSDLIALGYDLGQPTITVRSRRHAEPYCRLARHVWLQHKMPKRPQENHRLVGITAVVFAPPIIGEHYYTEVLLQAMDAFVELRDHVSFPVVSGLIHHSRESLGFVKKMQVLRSKCRNLHQETRLENGGRESVVPIQDWPWTDLAQATPPYEIDEDDVNFDCGALSPETCELHASRDVSVCLLYRLVLVTHSILQYLVFTNVGGATVSKDDADEVLIVSIRQQVTESVLEMFLEPSARVVDALFEAVMAKASALILKNNASKNLRVRTLQQCRLGSAVASWQLATLVLTGVSEAFAAAMLTEVGRDERIRKYCHDCLSLIPRFKDDCLYHVFQALSLRHRKLAMLRAQHTEPLDPMASKAVVVLANVIITYALHLFRTQKMAPKHAYLREQDLMDDFGSFLACLSGRFNVVAPQPATTLDKMTGGRLREFMTDMLVAYYKEVVEPSSAGDAHQTTTFE